MPSSNPVAAADAVNPSPVTPQAVVVPLTSDTIFLVLTIAQSVSSRVRVRTLCADLSALLRAVGFRDPNAKLSCVMAFGSEAWDRFSARRARRNCIPFGRFAPGRATPSPLRAICCFISAPSGMDLCFEFATQIMARLGDAVSPVGRSARLPLFRRSRPARLCRRHREPARHAKPSMPRSIGDEDPAFAGGSYVIVQKYLHDHDGWNALSTEAQERIIGRKKLSDIELDDSVQADFAHNALTTIVENGKEIKILRDNMPFGRPGARRVRHLFHRLQPFAPHHRADAREHVRRPAARQLRPAARFQPRRHRHLFFVPSATFLEAALDDRRAGRTSSARRRRRPAPSRRPGARRFARHRFPQRRFHMNNLHRELAPISDAAWAQIEEETSRTLKRYLAGRRVVDVQGPAAPPFRGRHRPPADDRGAERRHHRAAARGEAAGRAARSVRADRQAIDDVERGATTPTGSRRRTPPPDRLCRRSARSSRAMRPPASTAFARGPAIRSRRCPADVREYPDAIAQALSQLRLVGVNGPYSVLLGADAYTALAETSDHGYPVLEHVKRLVDDEIIWAPAIAGAFVLTTRGGDFDLHIGQDVSIGYLSHTDAASGCICRRRSPSCCSRPKPRSH